MQPFLIEPNLPVQVASVFAFVLMGVAFLLVLAKQEEPTTRLRMLGAAAIVLLFVGARMYAAEDQYLPNPCDSCANASGLLWWMLGCWAC